MLKKADDAPNLGGRPEHEPTAETTRQAEFLASRGCSQMEIACVLGISEPTLRKHYAGVLNSGEGKGKARLRQQQFKAAEDGNATMLIWLGKTWLGQKETVVQEHKFADMSDEDLDAALARILSASSARG